MKTQYRIGDGITELLYSDRHSYTIIAISKNGNRMTIQRDKVTLNNNFHVNMQLGGFVGHVTNNHEQSYIYEANRQGHTKEISLRTRKHPKKGKSTLWVDVERSTASVQGHQYIDGRHEFYDFNF